MPRPNYMIMGAPKCGTTALSEYLRQHPNVFVSLPKELHFFATDMPNHGVVDSMETYLGLFAGVTEEETAIGEASVWQLYSTEAAQNVYEFDPAMKLIVMVRNPADLVYSMHSQALFSLAENEKDFQTAWELSPVRKAGRKIPHHCDAPQLLYYDEIAKLGEQLERLYGVFPREQVKLIFYDDFSASTSEVYREVLQFLGVPDDHQPVFNPVNRNKTHRYAWLGALTQKPPRWLRSAVKRFKQVTGIKKLAVMNKLKKIDLVEVTRPPLSQEMRRVIIENYREDIGKLSAITGRNLDHWLEV